MSGSIEWVVHHDGESGGGGCPPFVDTEYSIGWEVDLWSYMGMRLISGVLFAIYLRSELAKPTGVWRNPPAEIRDLDAILAI